MWLKINTRCSIGLILGTCVQYKCNKFQKEFIDNTHNECYPKEYFLDSWDECPGS